MSLFFQFILVGVGMGSVYALMSLGFSLVFKETGVINFAQGEFAMVAAMVYWMLQSRGWNAVVAILTAIIVAALLGAAVSRFVMYYVHGASIITLIFITLGLDTALRGMGTLLWGTNPMPVNPLSKNTIIHIGGAVLSSDYLWVFGAIVVVGLGIYLLLDHTYLGRSMAAAMDNPLAARLYGMNPLRFGLYIWVLAAVIGAVGGIVLAPITTANANMGLNLGLNGFVGAIIGGIDSLPGAALGGLVLGIVESLASGYIASNWAQGVAFLILLILLIKRPQGLLGTRNVKRV